MTPAQEHAERAWLHELLPLERDWGYAYVLWYTSPGPVWHAKRRDDGAEVKADWPRELRRAIEDDHATKAVPKSSWIREPD